MNEEIISPISLTGAAIKNRFLPVLPLKNMTILPKSIIPVIVGRKTSIKAVEAALQDDRMVFVTAQRDTSVEKPEPHDLYMCGTRAMILQVVRMPKGGLKILVEGMSRSRILTTDAEEGYIRAQCVDIPTIISTSSVELEALWRHVRTKYSQYCRLNSKLPADLLPENAVSLDMEHALDTLLIHIIVPLEERQKFLEIVELSERLLHICMMLDREITIFETEERIKQSIQNQVEKNQREYYLNEQIKAINKELGRDDQQHEIQHIRAKVKKLQLSQEPAEKIERELKRLELMPSASAEASVIRHYIEWILALPWHKKSRDNISIATAEKILDKQHAGLKKPKERIIEFLAAKKFSLSLKKSPIICLVGPPGVGKTSLASAIAESLGREFRRISLGGLRDEAEIRGHRRTYISALPGKILQAMRQVSTVNPVILLDEIDKMSVDAHGDPAAALLEVLDPEQNKAFFDHFLEISYDLSQVMFIATANQLDGIPYPLHDRMELIFLSGYSEQEKLDIAHKFLLPRNLKEHDLTAKKCKISQEMLLLIIREYTKEAGVRQLERILTKILRKVIQLFLDNPERTSCTLNENLVRAWLGHPKFKIKPLSPTEERIGLASGLAWTEVGGDLLEIETSIVTGKGNVTLTGQLGDVMQESAYAALTYIRSRAPQLGLKPNFNTTKDIHIHIPEGSTPKDGPSAGITLCTAMVSEMTKNPVNPLVAMTGEITLRGRVLPVGGLKEKILAAWQHGIKTIILPRDNKEEIEEMKSELNTRDITLKFVDTMDEVLEQALIRSPFLKSNKSKRDDDHAHASKAS
jgi:ATP-dependent Lon protease